MESVEANCFIANSINARVMLTRVCRCSPTKVRLSPIKRMLNRLENDLSRSGESTCGCAFGVYTDAKHYETRGHGWKALTSTENGCEDEYQHD
jgi:hypothetical protein